MRSLRTIIIVLCLGSLSACAQKSPLPSTEVLQRSIVANRQLQSVAFDGTVHVEGHVLGKPGTELDIQMDGHTQNAGAQIRAHALVDGELRDGDQIQSVQADVDVLVADEQEVYVQILSLELEPGNPVVSHPFFSQMMLNKWWRIPSQTQRSTSAITPDPRFLEMQVSVISVTKDRGVTNALGRPTYLYDVTIDPKRLKEFLQQVSIERGEPENVEMWMQSLSSLNSEGQIWIDQQTFEVLKVRWSMQGDDPTQPQDIEIDLNFHDHGLSRPIHPPEDAQPLPMDSISLPLPPTGVNSLIEP